MRNIVLFIPFIAVFLVAGCDSDSLKKENNSLISRLSEANKQIEVLNKDKDTLRQKLNDDLSGINNQLVESETARQQLANEFDRYKKLIEDITDIKDFQFEIVSPSINRDPRDKVVYIDHVPEENADQMLYLLKAALVFSDNDAPLVTFWRDRNKALLYKEGKFDPEEGPLGWSGFDYRFGAIVNEGQHPKLIQYNSRDDSQLIDFGKYSSRE